MGRKCKIDLLLLVLWWFWWWKEDLSRAILANFPNEKIAMIEHDSYYRDQVIWPLRRIKTNMTILLPLIRTWWLRRSMNSESSVDIPTYDYARNIRAARPIVRNHKSFHRGRSLSSWRQASSGLDGHQDFRWYGWWCADHSPDQARYGGAWPESGWCHWAIPWCEVKPMYHQFIRPTKRYADVIIPEGADQHSYDWLDHNQDWENPQRGAWRRMKVGWGNQSQFLAIRCNNWISQ